MKTIITGLIGLLIVNIFIVFNLYNQDMLLKVQTVKLTELNRIVADTQIVDDLNADFNITIDYLEKEAKELDDKFDLLSQAIEILATSIDENGDLMDSNTVIYNKQIKQLQDYVEYYH